MEKVKRTKKQYDNQYAKEHYKRVPLDLKFELYNKVAAAADAAGVGVNTFIRETLEEKLNK